VISPEVKLAQVSVNKRLPVIQHPASPFPHEHRLLHHRLQSPSFAKPTADSLELPSFALRSVFPEMTGLSARNLWDARKLFLTYHEGLVILQQAVAELPDASEDRTLPNLAQTAREILRQAVAELESSQCPAPLLAIPWGHNLKITEKLKDPALRLWYAAQAARLCLPRVTCRLTIDRKVSVSSNGRTRWVVANFA
jgi:hypothetical protein